MTEADTGAAPSGATTSEAASSGAANSGAANSGGASSGAASSEQAATGATALPPSRSEQALAAHARRVRRGRVLYGSIVGGLVVAVLIGVIVAWNRGEISHATLHTFAPPPAALAQAAPSSNPHPAWRTTDRLALGAPQYNGTVVTYSKHTVGGRDARTGKRTWSYTRSDRTVCVAAQTTSTTIAVFELHGNCDEVAAFSSDTGRRRWTRTLDKDGRPINGQPAYQLLSYTFMVTSGTTIYAIDPVTGFDRWTYYRYGCRIQRAVLGSAGALISQTCGSTVDCKGVKFCARGPQLLLRDGSAGNADNGDNRDQITWLRRGNPDVPVAADSVVAAAAPDGRTLTVLDAKTGAPQRTVDLGQAGDTTTTAVGLSDGELIWRAGTTYAVAVAGTGDKPAWTARTSAPPNAVTTTGDPGPSLATARITATDGGDVVTLAGTDGAVRERFAAGAAAGSVAYPLGTGYLIGGPAGATAYR